MPVHLGPGSPGHAATAIDIGDDRLTVYTYTPDVARRDAILLLFHGKGRKADAMIQAASWIADRTGIQLVAPRLTQERFPNWRYHRAGIFREGALLPPEYWTVPLVWRLADWSRQALDAPMARAHLYGHSAGGQFLSRVMAYGTIGTAHRTVIANPSLFVLPSRDEPVPYGFAGGFGAVQAERLLRAYLRQPLVIYVGGDDTTEKDLVQDATAARQGPHRLARAHNTFRAGQRLAGDHGWEFNWQLVIADGIGHSSTAMLQAPVVLEALGLSPAPDFAR